MNTPNPVAQTSVMAVASLVAGILAWVMLPVLGPIVAVITGHMARAEIRRSQGRITGDGLAIGGLVLGYLQLAMVLLGILLLFLFFGGLAALATFANFAH